MVAQKRSISSKFRSYNRNQDLNDWIKNIKTKKIVKKKETRGTDLRVLAVLSQALRCAEDELKRKQEERALKWAQIRMRLNEPAPQYSEDEDQTEKQKLWKCELNGINSFINDLNQIKTTLVR